MLHSDTRGSLSAQTQATKATCEVRGTDVTFRYAGDVWQQSVQLVGLLERLYNRNGCGGHVNELSRQQCKACTCFWADEHTDAVLQLPYPVTVVITS